jgi:CRP-like cAMP-binding protein
MSEQGDNDRESETLVWLFKTSGVFKDQTDSLYESLEGQAAPAAFAKGQILPLWESGKASVFFIASGQVKLRRLLDDGREVIVDVAGPRDALGPVDEENEGSGGERFGEMATEAVAVTAVQAFRFDLAYFREMTRRRPSFIVNLSRIAGERQRRLELRLSRLLYRSGPGKVAGFLSDVAERYGQPIDGGGIRVEIPLTHQEIASMVGISRQWVCDALARLEVEEVIQVGASANGIREVVIRDWKRLNSLR